MTASPAGATWSIAAADSATGEVGVAIASCVPGEILGEIDEPLVPVVLQPGVSAAVTQAQLNVDAPRRIVELTDAGATPSEIIDDLTSGDYDELAPLRQHAVAAVTGEVAAATGADNPDVALDAQGDGVSAQGNLLVDAAVVDDALAAFEATRRDGEPLADALVAGLAAGATAGGDRRCGTTSALFAQLAVAGPDDGPATPSTLLTVLVDDDNGDDPVQILVDAHASGERGVIDRRTTARAGGSAVLATTATAAGLLLVAGVIAWRRGIGSRAARR